MAKRATDGPPNWIQLCRIQQQILSRLRDELATCKLDLKAASQRVERAQADLEALVRDSNDGQLFGVTGVLEINPKTGRISEYKSIKEQAEDGDEPAENDDDDEKPAGGKR